MAGGNAWRRRAGKPSLRGLVAVAATAAAARARRWRWARARAAAWGPAVGADLEGAVHLGGVEAAVEGELSVLLRRHGDVLLLPGIHRRADAQLVDRECVRHLAVVLHLDRDGLACGGG